MKTNVLEQGPESFAVHASHIAGKSTQTAHKIDAAE
jgi:hypothetical protein